MQAASGTFLEAVGVTYGTKAVIDVHRGTTPKTGVTFETATGKDFDQLKSIDGITYDGSVYRYENPSRTATTWDTHEWNTASDHRYSGPGKGGVYGATSPNTALKEIEHYNALEGRELVSKDVQIENVLDLTNKSVRKKLGITLKDLVRDDYSLTQKIGDRAREAGFNGILAPSARNKGGANLISFEGM